MAIQRQPRWRAARLAALLGLCLFAGLAANDEPEFAPIVERQMKFGDFTLKTLDGEAVNLRDYASRHRVTIIGYVAGWCRNSNDNGHVVRRLYERFRERGLGVLIVGEYSTADELRIHINRVGMEYPVVVETDDQGARKKSHHYRIRQSVGDKRKWGTPFYVIVRREDIEPQGPELAHRVFTVSGEIIEDEAIAWMESALR